MRFQQASAFKELLQLLSQMWETLLYPRGAEAGYKMVAWGAGPPELGRQLWLLAVRVSFLDILGGDIYFAFLAPQKYSYKLIAQIFGNKSRKAQK